MPVAKEETPRIYRVLLVGGRADQEVKLRANFKGVGLEVWNHWHGDHKMHSRGAKPDVKLPTDLYGIILYPYFGNPQLMDYMTKWAKENDVKVVRGQQAWAHTFEAMQRAKLLPIKDEPLTHRMNIDPNLIHQPLAEPSKPHTTDTVHNPPLNPEAVTMHPAPTPKTNGAFEHAFNRGVFIVDHLLSNQTANRISLLPQFLKQFNEELSLNDTRYYMETVDWAMPQGKHMGPFVRNLDVERTLAYRRTTGSAGAPARYPPKLQLQAEFEKRNPHANTTNVTTPRVVVAAPPPPPVAPITPPPAVEVRLDTPAVVPAATNLPDTNGFTLKALAAIETLKLELLGSGVALLHFDVRPDGTFAVQFKGTVPVVIQTTKDVQGNL